MDLILSKHDRISLSMLFWKHLKKQGQSHRRLLLLQIILLSFKKIIKNKITQNGGKGKDLKGDKKYIKQILKRVTFDLFQYRYKYATKQPLTLNLNKYIKKYNKNNIC